MPLKFLKNPARYAIDAFDTLLTWGLMGEIATTQTVTDDPFLDEPEAVAALAVRSFADAKRAAIAENDRLGIPSYGATDGKIVVRKPSADDPLG